MLFLFLFLALVFLAELNKVQCGSRQQDVRSCNERLISSHRKWLIKVNGHSDTVAWVENPLLA